LSIKSGYSPAELSAHEQGSAYGVEEGKDRAMRRGVPHTDDCLRIFRSGGAESELAQVLLGLTSEGVESRF
jgi:hypothetical protein